MADNITTRILDIQVRYKDALDQIASYRKAVAEAQAQQKQWKKDVDAGTLSQSEYAHQLEASRQFILQQNTAINTLTRQISNQQKTQQENDGSLVQWRATLSSLTAEYDRLSQTERESAQGSELRDKINEVTTQLKEAEAATQRFQRNVGNYPNAMGDLRKSFTDQVQAIAGLQLAYNKLSDAEKKGAQGQQMAKNLADMRKQAQDTKTALDEQTQALQEANASLGAASEKPQNVTMALREMVQEIAMLTIQYRNMSAEEQASAEGTALRDHINDLTEKAGEFKDAYGDASAAIDNAASDTRGFDQVSSAVQLCVDGFGLATGAAHMLGMSEEDLIAVQTNLQSAIAASNALSSIQNALQKQSALMQGVNTVQTQAAAMAETIRTAAVGKGVIATKAATIAQAAFNAVAKANPYVLLAAAVITVVGALALFSKGSDENAKREEERKKKMEEAKAAQEKFSQTVVDSAGKQVSSYLLMKREWESLGNSVTRRSKWIADCKDKFKELGLKISSVSDAERVFVQYTQQMVAAITKRAMIKAYQAQIEQIGNDIVKGIQDNKTFTYHTVKSGAVEISGQGAGISGQSTIQALTDEEKRAAGKHLKSWSSGGTAGTDLDAEGAAIINELRKKKGNEAAIGRQNAAFTEGQKKIGDAVTAIETLTKQIDKSTGGLLSTSQHSGSSTTTRTSGSHSTGGGRTGGGGSGGSGASNADVAKTEEELLRKAEDEMLKITEQSVETRRKTVEISYDRQIEDYRLKLTTDKTLTEKSKEAILSIIDSLGKQKQNALDALNAEEIRKEVEHKNQLLSLEMAAAKEKSDAMYDLKKEQLENQEQLELAQAVKDYANEEERQKVLAAIKARYAQQQTALDEEKEAAGAEAQRAKLQNEIDALENNESERLLHRNNWRAIDDEEFEAQQQRRLDSIGGFEAVKLQKEEEMAQLEYEKAVERGQLSTQTEDEYNAELNQKKEEWLNKQVAINDAYVKNEQAKQQAVKSVVSGLTSLLDVLGESNKAFAQVSKIVTLAQIAIDTGKALSSGIASASALPFPANIAAIATTVATILANIATAISTVKSAKFAEGGKVNGPGTSTSDSIPASLSNGEFVMTAKATRLYEPLLIAMNRIGSGVPFQVASSYRQAETASDLADSFADAAREIKPVVSVVEITDSQQRVQAIENLDTF